MANTEKKSYTFLNVVTALGKEDKKWLSATIIGTLTKIEQRMTPAGKDVVVGRMPINGRSKSINKLLGTSYNNDDTVWVDVSVWEDRAVRFINMLQKLNNPDKLRLVICGSLSKRTYKRKDETEGAAVSLAVQDWSLLPTANNGSGANSPVPTAKAQPQNSDTPQLDEDGFYILDENGAEDDLPF